MHSLGSNVLVTGCNRGIGLELVKRLVAEGCKNIFACSRSMSPELEELTKLDPVHHISLEITNAGAVEAAFTQVEGVLGDEGLNILINNAAVVSRTPLPSVTSPEELMSCFNINVAATHSVTQKFSPLLIKAAAAHSDKEVGCSRAFVMNVSSAVGSLANTTSAWASAYRVSKAALNMLTRCTAIELLEKDVLCLAVHPGWVQTDMGGPNALITTETSVNDLMELLQNSGKEHSGLLMRNKMEIMPF